MACTCGWDHRTVGPNRKKTRIIMDSSKLHQNPYSGGFGVSETDGNTFQTIESVRVRKTPGKKTPLWNRYKNPEPVLIRIISSLSTQKVPRLLILRSNTSSGGMFFLTFRFLPSLREGKGKQGVGNNKTFCTKLRSFAKNKNALDNIFFL